MSLYVYILASQRNGTLYIGYTDETRDSAWLREQRMKKWNRAWKIELIERFNPGWSDLTGEITA